MRFAALFVLVVLLMIDSACGSSSAPSRPPPSPVTLQFSTAGIAGAGGTVTVSPTGSSCGTNCVSFAPGVTVTLTATPAGSTLFAAWEGNCAGQGAVCTLTMTANEGAIAHFRPNMNVMFVTSGTITPGTIGSDLASADAFCSKSARAAFLGGTSWKAWLATTTTSAVDHVGASVPGWIRVDGRPFALGMTDLIQGKIFYPPRLTETGLDRAGTAFPVATGSKVDGNAMPGENCTDWSSTAGSVFAGDGGATTGFWSTEALLGGPTCGGTYPLYCFEAEPGLAPVSAPAIAPGGRHAFLSKTTWEPGGGPATADAVCEADASTAGLANPGNYQALITTDAAAAARFDLAGAPWFRLDGAQLVATASDLGDASGDKMLTPINLDSGGSYIAGFNAWTGSEVSPGVSTRTVNCSNWTTFDGGILGSAGLVNITRQATPLFWANNELGCNASLPVYCLER